MKKIAITLLAIITVSVSALAQDKKEMKHQGHIKHHHGMMAKQLNFSEAQKQQAKTYREDFKKKMQDLNKNEGITVKEFRDRKASLRKEQKTKMDDLLTAEQKTKMSQLKAAHKAKKDEHFAKHLDKMKNNLSLTDDQVAKLKAQRENMHSRMKAIKENESLTREQRKDQIMALRAAAKDQHKKIFTEDQLKKMEDMKKKHVEKTPAR